MQPQSIDFGRRNFLKLSSVAIATAAVAPRVFAGAVAGEQPNGVAVGFVALDRTDSPLVSANSIPSSDGAFIGRGARVSVLSAGQAAKGRRVAELCAVYSYFDGASLQQAPFCAGAMGRAAGAKLKVGNFEVPVDLSQKLSFTVTGERAVAAPGVATARFNRTEDTTVEKSVLPVTFALANEAGAFALARGFYVIAPMYAGDDQPRWSSYSLRQDGGSWSLVGRDGEPAPFEHFVIRIDYGLEKNH